jgi:hypothetical protein
MDVRYDKHRARHATAIWRITRANDAERARSRDTWCHLIADLWLHAAEVAAKRLA